MINKFRIISTHGVKSVLGTGWFFIRGAEHSVEKYRCACSQYIIYCWNAVFQDNCIEFIEDEEQVDIETVEELSEEINVAQMKTTAAHMETFKQP